MPRRWKHPNRRNSWEKKSPVWFRKEDEKEDIKWQI